MTILRIGCLSLISSLVGTAASMGVLLLLDQDVSTEDAVGIGIFSFVPSLLSCIILFTPGLYLFHKQSSRHTRVRSILLGILLNIPAFGVLSLGVLRGGFFGAGEVWYFVIALAVSGAAFGLGYHRLVNMMPLNMEIT